MIPTRSDVDDDDEPTGERCKAAVTRQTNTISVSSPLTEPLIVDDEPSPAC